MAGRGAADRLTRRMRATEREIVVIAAVLETGSEKAAAHRLGLSHSTVKHHRAKARSKVGAETTAQLAWILAEWLPEPQGDGGAGECRVPGVPPRAQLPSAFGSRALVAAARTRRLGPQALPVSCRDGDGAP